MPLRHQPDTGLTGINGDIRSSSGQSATRTHISPNIWIFASKGDGSPIPVGAVQNLDWTEARDVKMINEIGTDGNIDSLPNQPAQYSGNVSRVRWNGRRLFEAFGRGFLHVSSMRVPFDIVVWDRMRGDNAILVTTLENVWFTNLQVKYNAQEYIITDTASFKFETIYTTLNGFGGLSTIGGTGKPNNTGLLDPSAVYFNPYEAQADVGMYRGALDAAGLLQAYNGSTSTY